MEIIRDLTTFISKKETALTIGKFDGIHLGHRELILRTVKTARERGLVPAALVINMSPVTLLSKREREEMLGELGIELLIEVPLSSAFIRTSAEEFLSGTLHRALRCRALVVGADFRFGYQRQGSLELLQREGVSFGMETIVVPHILDASRRISSSRIREDLASGRIEEANRQLGYNFFVTGEIIHGRQIGRTLGVPTANLIADQSKYLPPNGVYYTISTTASSRYAGVTNIGTKPTVDGHFVGVETYFFDCDEDLYGEDLKVSLLHFARPEKRFGSLEELKRQIEADEAGARRYFG